MNSVTSPSEMQVTLSLLINMAIILYVVSIAVTVVQVISRSAHVIVWGKGLFGLGWGLHTAAFIMRWIETYRLGFGHVPVTNRYESLLFFGWCLALGWLIAQFWIESPGFALGVQIVAAAMTASTGLLPEGADSITPIMPALKSNWLLFHVVTCFLAYSAFLIATVLAIKSLISRNTSKNTSNTMFDFDTAMYRAVTVGFFLLTLGILSGSAWAQRTWGRYWGWDNKETWSLITWFIYAIFLHVRISRGWAGKRLAALAIIGFIAVLVTYLGVNLLPQLSGGLHSYA